MILYVKLLIHESRGLTSQTVKLFVGATRECMTVHKGLLCTASPVFEAALTGNFAEAATNELELLEEETKTMENFLDWLYFNHIGDDTETMTLELGEIERLYIFADKRRIPQLMNQLINAWHQRFSQISTYSWTSQYIWKNSVETLKLRKLMVDVAAHVANDDTWKLANCRTCSKDFLAGVIQVSMRKGFSRPTHKQTWLAGLDLCKYHEHNAGEPCSVVGSSMPLKKTCNIEEMDVLCITPNKTARTATSRMQVKQTQPE